MTEHLRVRVSTRGTRSVRAARPTGVFISSITSRGGLVFSSSFRQARKVEARLLSSLCKIEINEK